MNKKIEEKRAKERRIVSVCQFLLCPALFIVSINMRFELLLDLKGVNWRTENFLSCILFIVAIEILYRAYLYIQGESK